MRAADSDRQFVADRLKDALDEGRLDLGEYDERLQQAYAARTYGELDKLLNDLPTVRPAGRSQVARTDPPAASARSSGHHPWLVAIWSGWLTTTLVCFVIWALTGAQGFPWPLWVAGPWGAILLARTLAAFASGDPAGHVHAEGARDRERQRERWEREQERRERQQERRERRRDR
jgi:hypothetical protein